MDLLQLIIYNADKKDFLATPFWNVMTIIVAVCKIGLCLLSVLIRNDLGVIPPSSLPAQQQTSNPYGAGVGSSSSGVGAYSTSV